MEASRIFSEAESAGLANELHVGYKGKEGM